MISKVNVFLRNEEATPVGTLVLTSNNICAFEYDKEWLVDGFSISPFELPLRPGVFTAQPQPFEGGFGVFDDSLPDGWGMLVLDRYLKKQGINLRDLSLLDRLSIVGTAGRGALEFQPAQDILNETSRLDFDVLAREAKKILENNDYYGNGIEEFQLRGGSPGGARPKVFTTYQDKEWLVKFPAINDPKDIGKVEYEYSLLAKKCGIEMPETRLFENKYFGVERFDRRDGKKIHVVSMAGLIRADYRIPSIDYNHIFKVARIISNDSRELWKIFRLMVFNYLIENKDDHAKNFAFIHKDGKWRFAPAFDILPSYGLNGYHTTSINDSITPSDEDLIELAVKHTLDKSKAQEILSSMRSIITEK